MKNEGINLPNNKTAALRRLSQLKRRFEAKNGQGYYADYVEFMKKLIDSGYAERVPEMPDSEQKSSDQLKRSTMFGTFRTMVSTIPKNLTRFVWSSIVLPSMKANR